MSTEPSQSLTEQMSRSLDDLERRITELENALEALPVHSGEPEGASLNSWRSELLRQRFECRRLFTQIIRTYSGEGGPPQEAMPSGQRLENLRQRLSLLDFELSQDSVDGEILFEERHQSSLPAPPGMRNSPNPLHQVLMHFVMPPRGSIFLRDDGSLWIPNAIETLVRERILQPAYPEAPWTGSDFESQRKARSQASPPSLRVRLSPFANREAIFNEIHASIALTTFMTAASFVFLGLVLESGSRTAGSSGQIDIVLLFISSFGFLFATLMYANASGGLARISTLGFETMIERGNRTSEYFGIYPLALGVPLAVDRLVQDPLVSTMVAMLSLVFLAAYMLLPEASLLDRDIGDRHIGTNGWRFGLALLVLSSMGLSLFAAIDNNVLLTALGAGFFVGITLLLFGLASITPESDEPWHYEIHAPPDSRGHDAQDSGRL